MASSAIVPFFYHDLRWFLLLIECFHWLYFLTLDQINDANWQGTLFFLFNVCRLFASPFFFHWIDSNTFFPCVEACINITLRFRFSPSYLPFVGMTYASWVKNQTQREKTLRMRGKRERTRRKTTEQKSWKNSTRNKKSKTEEYCLKISFLSFNNFNAKTSPW